jgi:hypothetical protein
MPQPISRHAALMLAAAVALGAVGCGSSLERYVQERDRERQQALTRTEPRAAQARVGETTETLPQFADEPAALPTPADDLAAEVAAFAARVDPVDATPVDPGVEWATPGPVPALEDEPLIEAPAAATFPDEPGNVTQQPVAPDPLPPIPDEDDNTATNAAASATLPPVAVTAVSLTDIDRQISEKLQSDPRDVEAHLEQQVLRWLRGEASPQMTDFAELPAEDRELIAATVDGLVNLRTVLARPGTAGPREKAQPIIDAGQRLARGGGLELASMQLASRIEGFGSFTPMAAEVPGRLPPGQRAHAMLYVEVENFTSRPDAEGQWETRLTEKLALFRESGLQVWATEENEVVDVARNRRDDFFLSRPLILPEDLPPGSYTLKMTLTDDLADTVSESTLPIRILPPGR